MFFNNATPFAVRIMSYVELRPDFNNSVTDIEDSIYDSELISIIVGPYEIAEIDSSEGEWELDVHYDCEDEDLNKHYYHLWRTQWEKDYPDKIFKFPSRVAKFSEEPNTWGQYTWVYINRFTLEHCGNNTVTWKYDKNQKSGWTIFED